MSSDEDGRSPSQRFGRLRILVTTEAGRPARAPGLATWLARVAPPDARGIVSLALVSDRRIRALNRRYRGIDRVTDVLSFAVDPHDVWNGPAFLGDVVIATGAAARQARSAGHSVGAEYRILGLHGLLHLLGYDHERDGGQMAKLERVLRRRGGLERGLIERARRR